jgi:methionyl-tRNA synthetase
MKDPSSSDRLLVTAALPYANGPIHIGHLAGAYLPADLYVRYQRLKGRDVAFVCGSDEMGVAILMRALREDRTPEDIIDTYHPQIRDNFERFGMSFDHYGRTSSHTHTETTQDFFRVLDEKSAFELKTEEQLYDPEAEMFLADRFVTGTCPVCGYEAAYGDQCEQCGSTLSPTELEDPRSTLTDATPELRETTHWYLPLEEMQPQLEDWIGTHPEWKNNVRGQIQSWFDDGLKSRAITRDVPWGVPVPEEVAERHGLEAEGKVIYVWFDAPIGYISATKEWAAQQGTPDAWTDYWQDEDTTLVHFIGKDNIIFHCLMFPSMLMEHGNYVLPDNVPANEFLTLEGEKLSTSRGWAVWLHEYLDDFADERHTADLLRYALAATLPETADADFRWEEFQRRVNGELANVFGNFVHRTLTFAHRYFDGEVPPLQAPSEADRAMLDALQDAPAAVAAAYDDFRTRDAVSETMALARRGNQYFNETEPWHTHDTDPQACANTIHISLQVCASLAVLFEPVVPSAAAALRNRLGLADVRTSTPGADPPSAAGWHDAGTPLLAAGASLPADPDGRRDPLFQKIDDDTIEAQIEKLRDRAARHESPSPDTTDMPDDLDALSAPISFDDFMELDLRAGTVTAAEPVPDADTLLCLQVDIGLEERQILAGVAEQMAPDDLVGLNIVVVANMEPKEMFGLESQGMVLMAEEPDGTFVPVTTDAENGSVVR